MLTQLITPNPSISCTPGMCLVYVRETFGVAAKYATATDGWSNSISQHSDQNFPSAVWVPVWFSVSDIPDGHVALRQPDGSIWSASDPTAATPIHHSSLSDLESYYDGRLTYLGWTEDIEGVAVVSNPIVVQVGEDGALSHGGRGGNAILAVNPDSSSGSGDQSINPIGVDSAP